MSSPPTLGRTKRPNLPKTFQSEDRFRKLRIKTNEKQKPFISPSPFRKPQGMADEEMFCEIGALPNCQT